MHIEKKSEAVLLRQKAEELLRTKSNKENVSPSEAELLKIFHELDVYQIELEMQNVELKTAKEQAEVASYKYSELYESAPSGYFILSRESIISELNRTGSTILGRARSQITNKRFDQFVTDETRIIFNLFLSSVFESRSRKQCDVAVSLGQTVPKKIHLTGIVSSKGEQCFLTAVDITDISRTTELLQENVERFKAVSQSANDAIITISSGRKIVDWNLAAKRIFGYSEEEVIGTEISVIIPNRFIENHVKNIDRILEGGEYHIIGKTAELYALHRNGNEIPIELSLSEWRTSSGVFFTGIIRDITERKRAQEERERMIKDLKNALEQIKTLSGIIPICAHCKKVRDDAGFWQQVESYVEKNSTAQFSHALCPQCADKYFPRTPKKV